ncbi:MAG: hypothetical protein R2786_04960 [Flavobacteriaceae bacterium]
MSTFTHIKEDFINNVTGYSALGIILSTCLGSIAVMQSLWFGNGFVPMLLVLITVAICSAHNAAILTVQKPSLIFKLLVASTLINLAIIFGILAIQLS